MSGEIVTIGNATIYHGDCREILPTLPKVDLVLTDPPYGLKRMEKGYGSSRFKGHGIEKDGVWWDKKPDDSLFDVIFQSGSNLIIWGSNNFNLPQSEYFLVWDKQQTVDNFASAELAYTDIKCPAKVFRYSIHQHNQDEKNKGHPTQKPVSLMEWCINLAPKTTSTVSDPFAGSGTTGVACVRMGKKFYGIERERKYFDIMCERIENAYRQERLFA